MRGAHKSSGTWDTKNVQRTPLQPTTAGAATSALDGTALALLPLSPSPVAFMTQAAL